MPEILDFTEISFNGSIEPTDNALSTISFRLTLTFGTKSLSPLSELNITEEMIIISITRTLIQIMRFFVFLTIK